MADISIVPDNRNPFTVISPENLDAQTVQQIFVEVFSDFPQIRKPGNSIIFGARGSGKSMMFRCLLPDVIMLHKSCSFNKLDFLAFHVSIKNTELRITDLQTLDQHHASFLINEHFFTVCVMIQILKWLSEKLPEGLQFNNNNYKEFFDKIYTKNLELCGCSTKGEFLSDSPREFFAGLHDHMRGLHSEFIRYVLTISPDLDDRIPPYKLPILTFQDFLMPFLRGLKNLPGFPNGNIYLLIDDADNLSKTQTKILNTWLATRTQPEISIKVSAQIGMYKSFITANGTSVGSPHDYQETNISDKYTTSRTIYYKQVNDILEKRLKLAGISNVTPKQFFPEYLSQEEAIRKEAERLRAEWEINGRGNRPEDDSLRYARPNYIRDLGGSRKARSTYKYAGLEHLVHLSSGVIRYVLDSAAYMYDETIKANNMQEVMFIPCDIQDSVAREQAEKIMFTQFRKLEKDEEVIKNPIGNAQKLQNLILSLGYTFHDILVSDRSERRVFSFALTNTPTEGIKSILDFGVQTGYLYESTIGNKSGTGRTWLYIMNRGLAPIFTLDPTGFAGYLFVTNEDLSSAISYGKRLRNVDSIYQPEQLTFFD